MQLVNGFRKGKYKIDAYQINCAVYHPLPTADSIQYFWARPSMSNVFESIQNDSLLPRERIIINTLNRDSCSMTGYVYHIFDLNGNELGWLPFDTTLSKSRFEYTLLTKEFHDAGIDEQIINDHWVTLYPNPSDNYQNLVISLQNNSSLDVNLYDIQGRLIRKVYRGKQEGKTKKLKIDVSRLSPGVYIYKIKAGKSFKSIEFIKQ